MQITLSKRGPVMWFLGSPGNIKVSLNAGHRGPVEVNFETLSSDEQAQLLNSLRRGQVTTDVPYEELHQQWAVNQESVEVAQPSPDPFIQQKIEAQQRIEAKRRELAEKKDKELAERKKRVENLYMKSFRAIKASISRETDTDFLKMLLVAEKANRNRKGVVGYINEKLDRIAKNKEKEIAKKIREQMKARELKSGETNVSRVVESEMKVIRLTPDELISAIADEAP